MGYACRIVCDSIGPNGKRLTTVEATYPRIVHAEIMTHRDRARNAASSRAIPFKKTLDMVLTEPFIPLMWGMEQSGMQTGGAVPKHLAELAEVIWLDTMKHVAEQMERLHNIEASWQDNCNDYERALGNSPLKFNEGKELIRIHKSLCNRPLEAWSWITVVMTATEWKNFFRLRCHPDAEIHFQEIANMMRVTLGASTPTVLEPGQWHQPYVTEEEKQRYSVEQCNRMSVARCARVSYLTQNKENPTLEADEVLFERLINGSGFGHWSPHEHVAQCLEPTLVLPRSGPFLGWKQFRKEFANENADT